MQAVTLRIVRKICFVIPSNLCNYLGNIISGLDFPRVNLP